MKIIVESQPPLIEWIMARKADDSAWEANLRAEEESRVAQKEKEIKADREKMKREVQAEHAEFLAAHQR